MKELINQIAVGQKKEEQGGRGGGGMFDSNPKPEANTSLIFGNGVDFNKSHDNMASFLFSTAAGMNEDKNSNFSFTTPGRLPSKTNILGLSNKK
jgi:hypothetical protein